MSESDQDMDDSNFDWDAKSGVTDGEKIIATAIKKNNKMSNKIIIPKTTTHQIDFTIENTDFDKIQI